MSRLGAIGGRLYRGEVSVEFVGRRKLWYTISGLILVISIVALAVRGLNPSVPPSQRIPPKPPTSAVQAPASEAMCSPSLVLCSRSCRSMNAASAR